MPRRSSSTGFKIRLNVSHSCADAVGVAGLAVGELDPSLDLSTGIATCVTTVRAAPVAESVRRTVSMPTAATPPSVVCANLRIENVPVTCDAASAATGVIAAGVTGDSGDGVCGGSDGVVGSGVVGGVAGGVVGGVSGGVVGSVGGVGVSGVVKEPVTGMTSLPDAA